MTDRSSTLDGTVFGDLPRAATALVAFAAIIVAETALDGWASIAVLVAAIAGFFATLAYLDRTPRGAERRRARDELTASLNASGSRAREIANWAPFVIAVVIFLAMNEGWPAGATFAGSLAIGFILSQLVFVLWLRARRSRPA